jgi:hypothetical protein
MKTSERMANYSVSKLRRRISALESEVERLRQLVVNMDRSPLMAFELLRGIVLSDCMTDEGDRLFQRSLSKAIEYLEQVKEKGMG